MLSKWVNADTEIMKSGISIFVSYFTDLWCFFPLCAYSVFSSLMICCLPFSLFPSLTAINIAFLIILFYTINSVT